MFSLLSMLTRLDALPTIQIVAHNPMPRKSKFLLALDCALVLY
ncbi:hypothetical protein ANRL4_01678 [Anaerolineae bacterium]|nr:hypothetical protein ANRL4_01678 [Anaerolineae bacterium]